MPFKLEESSFKSESWTLGVFMSTCCPVIGMLLKIILLIAVTKFWTVFAVWTKEEEEELFIAWAGVAP